MQTFTLILILCSSFGTSGECLDGKGWTAEHLTTKKSCEEIATQYKASYGKDRLKTYCIVEAK